VHCLPRKVLQKRDHHCTSTKFQLGVIRWVHELFKRPLYLEKCYKFTVVILPCKYGCNNFFSFDAFSPLISEDSPLFTDCNYIDMCSGSNWFYSRPTSQLRLSLSIISIVFLTLQTKADIVPKICHDRLH